MTARKIMKSKKKESSKLSEDKGQGPLIGLSKAIVDLNGKIDDMAEFLALKKQHILITGGSGTGKRIFVEAVLKAAKNKYKIDTYILDCTQFSRDFLRSELFGYAKGAFTGAIKNRPGLIKEADNGIIFFDEIGDLADDVKNKLLLALEGREVMPLGGSFKKSGNSSKTGEQFVANVAVISATNKDPKDSSVLPPELYFRISTREEHIPDLSQRKIDIIPLICKVLSDNHVDSRAVMHCWTLHNYYKILEYNWKAGGYRELVKEILHLVDRSSFSSAFTKSLDRQNEKFAKGKILVSFGSNSNVGMTRFPDDIFLSNFELSLRRSTVLIAPEDVLELLKMEIVYYEANKPFDHEDPRVRLNIILFIYGLLQNYQDLKAARYTPYTSYKKIGRREALDNFNFAFVQCDFILDKKLIPEILAFQAKEELLLLEMLSKYGYDEFDKVIRRLIIKYKEACGLTWPLVQAKFKIDRRTVTRELDM